MGHASKHRLASLLACLSLSDTNNNKRLCCFLVAYTSGPHLVPGADGAIFDAPPASRAPGSRLPLLCGTVARRWRLGASPGHTWEGACTLGHL